MNFTDNGVEIEFEAKLPLEDLAIYGAIVHEIDRLKMHGTAGSDKELCSLGYGKVIWQKFMYPLLKEIGHEIDAYPEDLAEDVLHWFEFCKQD